jgi:hypothetical protein
MPEWKIFMAPEVCTIIVINFRTKLKQLENIHELLSFQVFLVHFKINEIRYLFLKILLKV